MTAELQRSRSGGGPLRQPAGTEPAPPRRPGRRQVKRRRRLLADHPDWPLVALVVGFPVSWALGLSGFIFIILAIPMALRLYTWHANGRRLRIPPGFSIWLLFLVVMLAGVATLSLSAPGTVPTPLSHRLISYSFRSANYLAVTVLLLFAINLTERECSRRKLAGLLGLLGAITVGGGLAGIVAPHVQFTSPLAYVLPHSISQNTLIQSWMHPGLSQIQGLLTGPRGRPKAPFAYTNEWGNSIVILLPWLLVWAKTPRQRRMALAITVLAIAPIIYSLDRGTWLAVAFAIAYLAIRLAARGRLAVLGTIGAGMALAGALILVTPLHTVITKRFTSTAHNSNDIRSTLDNLAIKAGMASPLIGYGDLQHMRGSPQSIAVGPKSSCITCGQLTIGSTGQLWLLLVTDGILGTVLYLAFFAYGAWRFRRDPTPYGMAGVLVLLLTFVFMIAYNAVVAPLAFTMLAYALLFRNEREALSGGSRPDRARPGAGFPRRTVDGARTTAGRLLPPGRAVTGNGFGVDRQPPRHG